MKWVLWVQVITFIWLGVHFVRSGDIRLGVAQLLLAAVQFVIYGEGLI